jgi:GNAT superfamily N-acetyltransferase
MSGWILTPFTICSADHIGQKTVLEKKSRTVSNSICFSLFKDEEQIGFARVLTDRVAYAVILDMIIREGFRGQGLGKWLMRCIFEHPEITPLRQVLWTTDADNFYKKLALQRYLM